VAIGALLLGPVACSLATVGSPQSGSDPLSGGVTRSPYSLSRFVAGAKEQNPAWVYGLLIGNNASPALRARLQAAPETCRWAAATYPGQTASVFQLEVDRAIMPLGGFAMHDPSPTLTQFRSWVAAGQICYLVEQPEQLTVPGNSPEVLAIQKWVAATFHAEVTDGTTVYDLRRPLESSH
jgi:hypothetical protein